MHLRLIVVLLTLIFSGSSAWALNPKVKAVGLNAVYGSVGGALLGVSTLAFGAKGRVVAKGASLGLYFGLAFGAYVVMTHGRRYSDDVDNRHHVPGNNLQEGGGGFFRFKGSRDDISNYGNPLKDVGGRSDFYLRFFQYQF